MPSVTLTDAVAHTQIDAALVNNNNAALRTALNGGLDNSNVAPGADISVSKLDLPGGTSNFLRADGAWAAPGGGGGGATIPAGSLFMWVVAAAPTGWLLCDGSAVSRATYSDLNTLLSAASYPYGSGDGSTTFNVPDLRGRMPVGYAASGGHGNVATLGNNDGSALANRRPKHQHDVYFNDPGHTHDPQVGNRYVTAIPAGAGSKTLSGGTAYGDDSTATASGTTGITVKVNPGGSSSDTTSPNNAPAYVVINFIIKT